ncbi:MAG: glycosyltransferase family 2 protein [Planctomycetota bacterium]
MIGTVLAWAAPVVATMAAAMWVYINAHPRFGNNLRHRIDPAEIDDARLPPVALIVPGRDEAEHLSTTLAELCEQDYPTLRVIFVDDASTDATPRITADLVKRYPDRLTVVRNETDPPAGWVGKPWAVQQGVDRLNELEAADGMRSHYLCFTDADLHWAPDCLRSAMAHALAEDADVTGLFPKLTFGSVVEAIPQLQMVMALCLILPFDSAMDPEVDDALIGGGFILVKRGLYESVGGHEAVADRILEDIELGRVLKRAGGRLRIGLGPELQWCRMYNGWSDMWEGLTKNAYSAMRSNPLIAGGAVIGVVLGNVLPPVYAVGGLAWVYASALGDPATPAGDSRAWVTFFAGTAAYLGGVRATNAARRTLGLPVWYAFTMPIGAAVGCLFLIGSAVYHYTGGNRWKGRRYRTASK